MYGKMQESGLTEIIPLICPQLSGARILFFPAQMPSGCTVGGGCNHRGSLLGSILSALKAHHWGQLQWLEGCNFVCLLMAGNIFHAQTHYSEGVCKLSMKAQIIKFRLSSLLHIYHISTPALQHVASNHRQYTDECTWLSVYKTLIKTRGRLDLVHELQCAHPCPRGGRTLTNRPTLALRV